MPHYLLQFKSLQNLPKEYLIKALGPSTKDEIIQLKQSSLLAE